MMQTGLAPVFNKNTEILILGSAPSVQSLEKQQYYGNQANRFWQIIFTALQIPDPKTYHQRLQVLLDHHIGLWDVYQSFERQGSMDHHFSDYKSNDFSQLLETASIKTVIANGKTAYQEIIDQQLFVEQNIYYCLSTSGANNSRADKRQKEWQQVLDNSYTTFFGNDPWIKAAAFYLRYQVFVVEQQIKPYLEFDEQTNACNNYFVTFKHKEALATIRYETIDNNTISPDRFCVAKKARGQGIGSNLLKTFEIKAIRQGYQFSQLTAEKQAVGFYQKNGYQIISQEFLEDGLPCVKMQKTLTI
uniref:DNA-deoxyinosine glycosylase n=1 Tax=Tetragenococcus halophilus TaxID=51669 RepID=UPI002E18890D|nr:DNA-deoxyinosine glycosylase [Tetragenococcus halophilus]